MIATEWRTVAATGWVSAPHYAGQDTARYPWLAERDGALA
jgi:hypothetical protein